MTGTLADRAEYHLDYRDWDASAPTSDSSQRFVSSLSRALAGLGFFYLHHTPLEAQRGAMMALTEAFFALPLETRLTIDIDNSPHFRGYSKFGDERTQGGADMRDQIDYGPHITTPPAMAPGSEEGLEGGRLYRNLYGPNQFLGDDVLPGHGAIVTRWFETASEVSRQLTRALELALGVREGALSRFLDADMPFARMKTIRYPAGAVVDGIPRAQGTQQGVGAHKDSGWLTLLTPSVVAGLEVQDFAGEWLPVPYVEGGIIVNFGQQIENLTRGAVQAAAHRVVVPPNATAARYSVAFFSFPALEAQLSPLPLSLPLPLPRGELAHASAARGSIVCDVPAGDLYASEREPFGWIAWRGLVRSHPGVVKRFYPHLAS